MANKNTMRSKRGCPKEGVAPVTNQIEITIGTGAGRGFGVRNYEPIFKGKACNTARPANKKKWVGALRASSGNYNE
jgi:hypothetical protein